MNIESILQKAKLFKELVVDSGFKRDITDYLNSIQQSQNQNIAYLKDLSNKVIDFIDFFEQNNLNRDLDSILKDNQSFFNSPFKENLIDLRDDAQIDSRGYYGKLQPILSSLNNEITKNDNEINSILVFCSKYTNQISLMQENEKAIVSLIFKDLNSTSTIKGFTKSLNKWNTVLSTYHTILKSNSPTEIDLECIQNGSIDVVLNINVDVALNLTELFKYGMITFGSYMAYKLKLKQEILNIYDDNEELKELEEKKENLMLEHIKEKIKIKIKEQHQEHIKQDKTIDTTSLDKKIDNVSSLITEHIIKGNEFKLLSKIEDKKDDNGEIIESSEELKKELREATTKVTNGYKELAEDDIKFLVERFERKDESE